MPTTDTIQVVEVTAFGDSSVLTPVERAAAEPHDGRVRVAVTAATVNPIDLVTRSGAFAEIMPSLQPPLVLGWDFTGTLDDGTRVAGMVPWMDEGGATGGYASQLLADPAWFATVPDELDDITAATVPLNALTASQALGLAPGSNLLITGASGAVGAYAVQLAADRRVLAVASTGDEDYVAGLGASDVLARGDTDAIVATVRELLPDGVDAVVDAANQGAGLLGAIRDGGTYVALTGLPFDPDRGITYARQAVAPDATELERLLAAVAAGDLTTRIAGTLPLADAATAHDRLAAGGVRGRLVLTI